MQDRYARDPSNKILHKEITVPAAVEEVWQVWTTTEGVKTFFSLDGKVELKLGGAFEIYFLLSNLYGLKGSEGCRILSYLPQKTLSFEWNAPPEFGELREIHTQVVLHFESLSPKEAKVTLDHLGWGKGEEWEKLYDYFDRAWGYVLNNLKKRFEEGPIDWSKDE